jgi:glycosyltransferase involved in cell wall biosynthesis
VLTLHQVVDPATVDGSFTEMHRVRAPAVVARAGITGVQEIVRRLVDAVIVHEPAFGDHVEGARVIPHGVETPSTPDRAEARAALGIAPDRFTVMCFGFLAPYKGLERALQAAALAGEAVDLVVAGGEHPRLAGRDTYADDLRSRWGHVARFVGRVPDDLVATWFAAVDLALYLYPRPFSSSGALALALAHGTPFLVSRELGRCAGIPDELCVDRDAATVAERLVRLASQRNELAAVGATASDVSDERSWPRVARRHLALYEEVSHARRRARRGVRAA